MYLLDTNACIQALNRTSASLISRLRKHPPSEILLCSVVRAELLYGAHRSSRIEENLRTLRRFLEPFRSLPFDDASAEHYGIIRAELTRQGKTIGANDLMIAAIGRAHGAILVTHNTGEFSRVSGLRLEDWELS